MAKVTSRDVQEIVEKLSSDKAKAREEGIKLLNTWLEGERSYNFCKFIGSNTAKLRPDEVPHSETWPFLISLLIKSASAEISSSKRRNPKMIYAKTLRIVVQRAEDAKCSGKMLPLSSVVKPLFNHVWDVLSNVPSFQSEYGIILRHLLSVRDYSFQMRKRIYCNLVFLYIEKVEASLNGKNISNCTSKEEVFRYILTLHSLLKYPPGDYPDNAREDIVKGFVRICSFIREEGKISRKLVECINTYLLNDGPNLGFQLFEIHNAMQQFVFRSWLTTHDRVLKDSLVFYARIQLNLISGAADRCLLVEQLLDVICKDLDQGSMSSTSMLRGDGNKDDKLGALSSSQCGLVELAAVLFYRACLNTTRSSLSEKRVKREPAAVILREALMKGKWLWNAAFCSLTRNYHTRICKDLFLYWFEGICMSFDRILNSANVDRIYDGLLWTLRSLQELSSVLLLPNLGTEISSMPSSTLNEFIHGWQLLWSTVVHGLPIFSNINALVDAALLLLSNITSNDFVNTSVIPQDVWELQFFKRPNSVSILYFFSCYFSRKNSHADLRDILHLRKNLLRATLCHLNWKGYSTLNEQMVLFIPRAVYALCVGHVPFTRCFKELPLVHNYFDVADAQDDSHKFEEPKHQCLLEFLDCSVEVLTEIEKISKVEASQVKICPHVRVPREISDQLLHEMETSILGALVEEEINERRLPDTFLICSLLSNLLYGSFFTRKINVSFCSKLSQYLQLMLDNAVRIIQEDSDLRAFSCLGYDPTCDDMGPLVSSIHCFLASPIFNELSDQNLMGFAPFGELIQSVERLLKAFVNLYETYSHNLMNLQSDSVMQDMAATDSIQSSCPNDSSKSRIMDMELDVNDDSREVDSLAVGKKVGGDVSSSVEKWKMGMISLISSFFSASLLTWDILFKLMEKENDPKVRGKILYHLCQHPLWSSSGKFIDLVNVMNDIIIEQVGLKLACYYVLISAHTLLTNLSSLDAVGKDKCGLYITEVETEQCFLSLGNVVHKLSEVDLNWFGRVKLIDCICNLVLLHPQIGQTMIERLLLMLKDMDYRVRLFLARRIGVLFQTWDGHEELFQDICLNFGVQMVVYSKGKVINAMEVLAAGPQPQPIMETVVITLMHLALHSEKIELEAVFMICVVSAIDPYHRELVCAVLDNLSRELQYRTRMKYLEQLLGSILFCWVACGVSLAALVETRHLFLPDAEPDNFLQYCCPWLLPALLINENSTDLNWVAKVTCQPLTVLIKNHFTSIFSVSMALHCSKKPGSEKGTLVLQSSILHFAQISEKERDKLIKRHMVSIVSCVLSLCSCSSSAIAPFFSRDTVSLEIQTIVDGFLDLDDNHASASVVDKINIFRPDRVFMFLVEIHYKIAAASHYRHKCHRLAGIEVLISILGQRAAVLSTSNYLINLIGSLIECRALQDQCCCILSSLLLYFKNNLSTDVTSMLGEQLQFLVSKLVACCIPSKTKESCDGTASQALSLLRMLTVDSDSSMYDYVKELEPLPELKIFDEIRKFHEELCHTYSIRDHLLKFVKKSCYLPPRLLLSSLQALQKKLLNVETFQRGGKAEVFSKDRYWHGDHEIVPAVWKLVHMCGSDDASEVRELVSDFISRVGAGDPYSVVFHLPGETSHLRLGKSIDISSAMEISSDLDACISEELLVVLLKFLMKYLMDDSVKIVDMASQTLRGILSTERGQSALQSFDSYQRSLIEVHSKGVNIELVENLLLDLERKSKAEAISLEKSPVWVTDGKTFDMWICPLVYSLTVYCNDVILRLCQDIIWFKGEVAELLLPSIFVNIAARKDLEVDLHKLICLQLEEHVFTESNKLMKSIQVVLNCLNELRIRHVMERFSFVPSKSEVSKNSRPSSYSSKTRSTPAKARESAVVSYALSKSPSSWEKVYWLSIDYLLVAKLAASCGSYFTSVMYVEHWCEEQFKTLTIGGPDFSHNEMLPDHIEILVSAVTRINEPDSLYGILQSHKLTSQIITFEHEGNWGKALEYYDLQVQSDASVQKDGCSKSMSLKQTGAANPSSFASEVDEMRQSRPYKGLIRSLQQIGCTHVLDMYCHGLTSSKDQLPHDLEFAELQYESAWRAGNWDFSLPCVGTNFPPTPNIKCDHFNENLHSCLRALQEGDLNDFQKKLKDSKQELVWSVSHASEESTEYIYLTIIKLQMLYHVGMAWDLRWRTCHNNSTEFCLLKPTVSPEPVIPSIEQMSWLDMEWCSILQRTQLHMNLLEPFIAFRRVLLQVLSSRDCMLQHLLQSATTLRKGCRFSQAAAALHEFKLLSVETKGQSSSVYWLGRLEEAKLFRAQSQNVMAINLAMYISQNYHSNEEASDAYRLIGKWLAETRSSNSRTILEKYLKPAVSIAEDVNATAKNAMQRKCQAHFHLAHYADALFKSHEERLNSNEWQAAMRLRKHKTVELEALIKRFRGSTKGEKTDYSMKIQELQKQVAMDKEEAQKLQDDRDNFLSLALEGYKRCLVIGNKYDVRVVFRIVSLWFSLSSRKDVVNSMLSTMEEVQSFKFIPLVYQIASRMGNSKDGQGHLNFQFALVSLVKKMAIDHPYHTILQLLALANGDRIKDKQRSRSSFVVDMDKKLAAENLLNELSSYHGAIIRQMKQMVEIYIRLAEMETKREDTNKKVTLPRDLRNLPVLELVPVVTATISIDHSCQYHEGSFPYFKGLADSVMIMNGINAPKVVECLGSDGRRYRQLAKSGNDDLRQDAVMEQFFGLVNTFLRNHQDTRKRRLGVRTYKVVPFTPSAGVLEWVNGTLPLGEYLIGSMRNGGAHGRYGVGDWSFLKCREHMANERDKRKAFQEVCNNFRPVMHYFFLERFLQPAEWFEKRLAYTRSVAASSMVGYIVGLGDRHAMNILIDQATAEVVHIDLGVAFEQGLMLKTPERVPFRLTRDIIDGMGVTGVEGVFRRCCEETLSVMRTNKEALLTIVEVFIHDPLYKWALSPLKALQRQKEMDDDLDTSLEEPQHDCQGNKDAARALLRVKQKLDGYEDGEMRSIHGQVQQLIQDAIDSERLCQMFPGWGAWL